MAKYVIVLDNTIVIFFDGDAGTSVNFEDAADFSSAVFCSLSCRFDEQHVLQLQLLAASTPPPSPSFHPPLPQHMFEWVKCQVMLFREDLGDMSSYSGTNGARRFLSTSNCTLPDEEISRSFSELADRIPTFKWPWKDTGRWCDMPCPPSSMAAMVVLCHRRPWSNCYHYDCRSRSLVMILPVSPGWLLCYLWILLVLVEWWWWLFDTLYIHFHCSILNVVK